MEAVGEIPPSRSLLQRPGDLNRRLERQRLCSRRLRCQSLQLGRRSRPHGTKDLGVPARQRGSAKLYGSYFALSVLSLGKSTASPGSSESSKYAAGSSLDSLEISAAGKGFTTAKGRVKDGAERKESGNRRLVEAREQLKDQ
ncbi:unnamed protein product [Urochloa humidicola]